MSGYQQQPNNYMQTVYYVPQGTIVPQYHAPYTPYTSYTPHTPHTPYTAYTPCTAYTPYPQNHSINYQYAHPSGTSQITYYYYTPPPATPSTPTTPTASAALATLSTSKYDWFSVANQEELDALGDRVVIAGGDEEGPLAIIRAPFKNNIIPGKLYKRQFAGFVSLDGKEIPVINMEVLCAVPDGVCWVAASHGYIPNKAIQSGSTADSEMLYVGRATYKNRIIPGKVQRSQGCINIPFKGRELSLINYEVLCHV